MTQGTARLSLSIRIVTAFVLVLTVGFAIASLVHPALSIAAAILVLICFGAWVCAPVEYELRNGRLTVFSRLREKEFDGVVRCSQLPDPLPCRFWVGIRLFGNGGLFAGTGIFWNRMLGVFRAYVTSARASDMVLVETANRKILISPRNPPAFVECWQQSEKTA